MSALPNPSVPLFEQNGTASGVLRDLLAGPPANDAVLISAGRATEVFRRYLTGLGVLVPADDVVLADEQGRPTRVFHRLLWEATR